MKIMTNKNKKNQLNVNGFNNGQNNGLNNRFNNGLNSNANNNGQSEAKTTNNLFNQCSHVQLGADSTSKCKFTTSFCKSTH